MNPKAKIVFKKENEIVSMQEKFQPGKFDLAVELCKECENLSDLIEVFGRLNIDPIKLSTGDEEFPLYAQMSVIKEIRVIGNRTLLTYSGNVDVWYIQDISSHEYVYEGRDERVAFESFNDHESDIETRKCVVFYRRDNGTLDHRGKTDPDHRAIAARAEKAGRVRQSRRWGEGLQDMCHEEWYNVPVDW